MAQATRTGAFSEPVDSEKWPRFLVQTGRHHSHGVPRTGRRVQGSKPVQVTLGDPPSEQGGG